MRLSHHCDPRPILILPMIILRITPLIVVVSICPCLVQTSHSQIDHPHAGSPWAFVHCTLSHSPCLSLCLFGRTHNSLPPRVSSLVKICFFLRFFVFWRIFFPKVFWFAGILSSCPLSDAYCCTYRENVRNRLPLCQG